MGLFYAGQRILASYENQVSQAAPTQSFIASVASVTFSSIPAYNHLALIWHARSDNSNVTVSLYCQTNGNVSSGSYISQSVEANTSTVTGVNSGGTASQIRLAVIPGATANGGYFGVGQAVFGDISDTGSHSSVVAIGYAPETASSGNVGTFGGLGSGGPITTVTLFPSAGNFIAGSMFSLYGWM